MMKKNTLKFLAVTLLMLTYGVESSYAQRCVNSVYNNCQSQCQAYCLNNQGSPHEIFF